MELAFGIYFVLLSFYLFLIMCICLSYFCFKKTTNLATSRPALVEVHKKRYEAAQVRAKTATDLRTIRKQNNAP